MLDAPPRASRRLRWATGSALILAGIGGLAAWGMTRPGAISFYVTPAEVFDKGPAAYGPSLRVGGKVADGTLVRDGASVSFTITDGHRDVPVRYHGEIPDTLRNGTEVVAEGTLHPGGTLAATRVLAKCSSRFVPKVERDARAAAHAG
jgi:cytochrome c-type biogenesis protein CcmE